MLDFGDELAAVKANGANSNPLTLDAHVAGFDIPLSNAGMSLPSAAFDATRAKVVGLEFHSRYTIKLGRFGGALFFWKTIHSYPFVVCFRVRQG